MQIWAGASFHNVNFSALKGRGPGILKFDGFWILMAGSVRNVLCHGRALCATSWGVGGALCATRCVTGAGLCATRRVALCHGGGPVAQRVVSWRGLVRNVLGRWGGSGTARCVMGRPCAQRLVSWGSLVRNALCRGGESVRNASCHGAAL